MKLKIIYVFGLIGISFFTWHITSNYKQAVFDARLAQIERKEAERYAASLEEIRGRERENRSYAVELEVKYNGISKELADIHNNNLSLVRELERMQQQANSDRARRDDTVTVDRDTAIAQLSGEDAYFLIEFAREADEAAKYGMMCYEWLNKKNARSN